MKIIITIVVVWALIMGFLNFYVVPTGVKLCEAKGGIMVKSAYGYNCVNKDFEVIHY